ncbi:hypothetical protein BABINDRAFT_160506 [Babjeviella inositovora NRRL Y-12698]|uniref:Uncharacterized protein n=1 Tax=Babjeviella inositovora NRRL Y-12698 TaxID=984486 RepID=A0A1E3QTW4_9ASCO|nr:uncharacterized protein BABINDRAFT_160506 [Babjeviella inositovora NRRL Y-12698]ODQ81100.1 hypothetical protein BABINDRAFT_160506 [Babjeviella inositovora NRRL Y-12698]
MNTPLIPNLGSPTESFLAASAPNPRVVHLVDVMLAALPAPDPATYNTEDVTAALVDEIHPHITELRALLREKVVLNSIDEPTARKLFDITSHHHEYFRIHYPTLTPVFTSDVQDAFVKDMSALDACLANLLLVNRRIHNLKHFEGKHLLYITETVRLFHHLAFRTFHKYANQAPVDEFTFRDLIPALRIMFLSLFSWRDVYAESALAYCSATLNQLLLHDLKFLIRECPREGSFSPSGASKLSNNMEFHLCFLELLKTSYSFIHNYTDVGAKLARSASRLNSQFGPMATPPSLQGTAYSHPLMFLNLRLLTRFLSKIPHVTEFADNPVFQEQLYQKVKNIGNIILTFDVAAYPSFDLKSPSDVAATGDVATTDQVFNRIVQTVLNYFEYAVTKAVNSLEWGALKASHRADDDCEDLVSLLGLLDHVIDAAEYQWSTEAARWGFQNILDAFIPLEVVASGSLFSKIHSLITQTPRRTSGGSVDPHDDATSSSNYATVNNSVRNAILDVFYKLTIAHAEQRPEKFNVEDAKLQFLNCTGYLAASGYMFSKHITVPLNPPLYSIYIEGVASAEELDVRRPSVIESVTDSVVSASSCDSALSYGSLLSDTEGARSTFTQINYSSNYTSSSIDAASGLTRTASQASTATAILSLGTRRTISPGPSLKSNTRLTKRMERRNSSALLGEMTEAEKEEEAQRLMEVFERLDRLGVIKPVSKKG